MYVNEFVEYLSKARNFSPSTQKVYRVAIWEFSQFLRPRKMDTAEKTDVIRFMMKLSDRGKTAKTINTYKAALSSYFEWLCDFHNDDFKRNPCHQVPRAREEKKTPRYIPKEKIETLISSIEETDFKHTRQRTLLLFLFHTGARASEAANVTLDDVDLNRKIVKLHGKGKKERFVPLTDALRSQIEKLMLVRPHNNNYLFCTSEGHHLIYNMVYELVHLSLVKICPRRDAHPHVLRHSFATTLIQAGVPIFTVQRLLGHANINTTMVYLSLDFTDIQNDFNKALL